MEPVTLHEISFAASCIWATTFAVAFRVTSSRALAALSSTIKTLIFIAYFTLYFDGTFTATDDWMYLESGREILRHHINLGNVGQNWEFLHTLAGGRHVLYQLYNATAIYVFGNGYFAPVAGNIIATCFIAWVGTQIAVRDFNLTRTTGNVLFMFLLFQPNILAWSSIINLKDILVLLLHVLAINGTSLLYRRRYPIALLSLLPAFFGLMYIRFYAPLLILVAAAVTPLTLETKPKQLLVLLAGFVATLPAIGMIGPTRIQFAISSMQSRFINPLWGAPHFLLTPIPFNTDPNYRFLDFPAIFHFATVPFMVIGALSILRTRSLFARFFIINFMLFCCLYSVYAELQGPRHRVQLEYSIAVFQFLGIIITWKFLKRIWHRDYPTRAY